MWERSSAQAVQWAISYPRKTLGIAAAGLILLTTIIWCVWYFSDQLARLFAGLLFFSFIGGAFALVGMALNTVRNALVGGFCGIIGLVLATAIFGVANRFAVSATTTGPYVFVIDRFTGDMKVCAATECRMVPDTDVKWSPLRAIPQIVLDPSRDNR